MRTTITVTHSFKGLHCWPTASEFAGEEVKFLESPHRHTFFLTLEVRVYHDERDIEFFVLQNLLKKTVDSLYPPEGLVHPLGARSCERIAMEVQQYLSDTVESKRFVSLKVSEDNEVWATLYGDNE